MYRTCLWPMRSDIDTHTRVGCVWCLNNHLIATIRFGPLLCMTGVTFRLLRFKGVEAQWSVIIIVMAWLIARWYLGISVGKYTLLLQAHLYALSCFSTRTGNIFYLSVTSARWKWPINEPILILFLHYCGTKRRKGSIFIECEMQSENKETEESDVKREWEMAR